ncbi:MAG: DUF202 domain-containing protein, partial [Mycobacterium sp.]
MNELVVDPPCSGGLQVERTALAWRRTSLSVLADGVLPLFTRLCGQNGPNQSITASLPFAVALAACLVCRLRGRALSSRPLPKGITAKGHAYALGALVVVLIV